MKLSDFGRKRIDKLFTVTKNLKLAEQIIIESEDIKVSKKRLVIIKKENPFLRFEIKSKIGVGESGKVYNVADKLLGIYRVMKEMKANETAEREIEVLRSLSHPNIVDLYEVYQHNDCFYLITEVMAGEDLYESIKKKRDFSETKIKTIARQLLQTVNYLHSNNIIHRDIKPENIMFKRNGHDHVKLIDFGSAALLDYFSEIQTDFIGTCYYVAPEVIKNKYNHKCDIWSLGVVLYILLCGYAPFNGNSKTEIYKKINTAPVVMNGDDWKAISFEASDLVKKMLNKNADQRVSAEECLQHPWFTSLKTDFKNNQAEILGKIESFITENKLKQSILALISVQFDLFDQKQRLFNIFYDIDENNNGTMEVDEFLTMIESSEGKIDEEQAVLW